MKEIEIVFNYRPETYIKDIIDGYNKGHHTLTEALEMMETVLLDIHKANVEG